MGAPMTEVPTPRMRGHRAHTLVAPSGGPASPAGARLAGNIYAQRV